MTIDIYAGMHIAYYPFDRHLLPLQLSLRRWSEDKEGGSPNRRNTAPGAAGSLPKKHVWVLAKERPKWAPRELNGDGVIMKAAKTGAAIRAGFHQHAPIAYFTPQGKAILCMRVSRDFWGFCMNVMLPVFVVVLLSLGAFMLENNKTDTRFTAVATALLTLAVYQQSVASALPDTADLMNAEIYYTFAYMFVILAGLKIIVIVHWAGEARGAFGLTDGEAFQFEDSDSWWSDYRLVDDATTWLLVVVWFAPHLWVLLLRERAYTIKWSTAIIKMQKNLDTLGESLKCKLDDATMEELAREKAGKSGITKPSRRNLLPSWISGKVDTRAVGAETSLV